MLDVHIIIHPDTPIEHVRQCIDSVHVAMDQAGYPVDLHHAPFVLGNIGASRQMGYSAGVHPYVTCVDDDDWVEPNAFACLLPAMQENHAAIYTRETQHRNGKQTFRNLRQHLRVFRRDVTEGFDFTVWPSLDSTAIIAYADSFGDSVELPDRVYHYRVDPDSHARQILAATPGLMASGQALGNVHEVMHG